MVVAEGSAFDRGRTVGRELSDLIGRSIDFYHSYFDRRGVSSPQLQELLTPFMVAAETRTPEFMDQIKGMSEGATVPVFELFAVNAFEELEPLLQRVDGAPLFLEHKGGTVERCTTFVVATDEGTILAHNEHWLAGDANVALVIEIPDGDQPWVAAPVNVCCLPASGMNAHGVAMGIQSVTASDDTVGVPRVLVSRHTLDALDPEDAAARASLPGRAGGYGYVAGGRSGGMIRIETTATREATIDGPGVHTNHYLTPELAEMAPAPSPGSVRRYEAVTDALTRRSPSKPEDAMEILRDVDSVYELTSEDAPDDEEAIVYSMVCELESGRMWCALGDPKTTAYEEVELPHAA